MTALVVGYGRMGRFHAGALRDLGFDVVTEDPVVQDADVRCLTGRERRRFDVVCLAVPIPDLAREAVTLQGHEGWLLVEKPMAATTREAVAARDALHGQAVGVGYVERFNPQAINLKRRLDGRRVRKAVFVRCNDKPSPDVDLDLRSHDLDLAQWLGVEAWRCEFVARASEFVLRREVYVTTTDRDTLYADLTAHDESPLHEQWQSFLAGESEIASMDDAVRVLERLEPARTLVA